MKKAGFFLTILRKNDITKELFTLSTVILSAQAFTLICICIAFYIFTDPRLHKDLKVEIKGASTHLTLNAPVVPTVAPTQVSRITPTPAQKDLQAAKNTATQIDDVTWTVKVEKDTQLGSVQDIFNALNSYREKNGKGTLAWDPGLASYAQGRADLFAGLGGTDKHAGFNSLLENNGFNTLGFNSLGENSSFGYHVSGTKLIEEVYASDAPHNNNQLDNKWTHVGVGVKGVATDIIFGGNKQ